MTSEQVSFLRTIHFRIFKNNEKRETLMNLAFEDSEATIRNDQKISGLGEIDTALNEIVSDFLQHCES